MSQDTHDMSPVEPGPFEKQPRWSETIKRGTDIVVQPDGSVDVWVEVPPLGWGQVHLSSEQMDYAEQVRERVRKQGTVQVEQARALLAQVERLRREAEVIATSELIAHRSSRNAMLLDARDHIIKMGQQVVRMWSGLPQGSAEADVLLQINREMKAQFKVVVDLFETVTRGSEWHA